MTQTELYKSVLNKLSALPVDYLWEVDKFLSELNKKEYQKGQNNTEKILSFAGTWSDMDEEDFKEYLKVARETGDQLFSREVNL